MTTPVRARSASLSRSGRLAHTALRCALAAGAALAVAALHDAHDPGVLCPMRLLTGIPCPVCGSTTVFIEAGHGHWLAALTANPVTVVAAFGLLTAPLGSGAWWWGLAPLRRTALIAGAAVISWLWQLNRLGVLPS